MTSDDEIDIHTFLKVTRDEEKDIIRSSGLKETDIDVVSHCTFYKINFTSK